LSWSKYCRFELESFLARETALGRNDLIFPILYIKVPALDDAVRRDGDEVLSIITKRQYVDWSQFRHLDVTTPDVKKSVESFCTDIRNALSRPWLSPAEREAQDEAAALLNAERERERQEAAAEEKRRRKAAEAEAERRAEQKRQEAKAEAERQAEQKRRREETDAVRRAEEYARQQTAAQRLRSKAEVNPSAEEIARNGHERSEVLPGSSRRAALIAWSLLALSALAPLGASLASPQLARALLPVSGFAVTLYIWVVIVAAIFSWLAAVNVINVRDQAVRTIGEFLSQITAPALHPIRSILPNIGAFDISPVVLFFFLMFLRYATAIFVAPLLY